MGVHQALLLRPGPAAVSDVHAAGLVVHAWTLREENHFLPRRYRRGRDPRARGDASGLVETLFDLGVDGVFTDQPETAVATRRRLRDRNDALARERVGLR